MVDCPNSPKQVSEEGPIYNHCQSKIINKQESIEATLNKHKIKLKKITEKDTCLF